MGPMWEDLTPHIKWIIIYISINIPSVQELRVPIVQHSRCEGKSIPHAAQITPQLSQRGYCVTRLNGHHAIALQPVGMDLNEGRKLCLLWAYLLFT